MPTRALVSVAALGAASLLSSLTTACSSTHEVGAGPASGGNQAAQGGEAGTPVGGSASAGVGGSVGPVGGAGSGAGGAMGGRGGTAGASTTGGVATGGAATAGSAGQGSGGIDPGDTPPTHTLNVTASMGEHIHGNAGVDTRAKLLGKLVVDIGVNSGGYVAWLAKRGYHSIGAPCGACAAPDLGNNRDDVGTCRLGEFATTTKSVQQTLTTLQQQFPEEDWGYFLNKDGTVRWSDVAITGISHGATTAAIAGRLGARMWRVVSRSGPRDNTCGLGNGNCTLPLSTPSYDAACPDANVASWLDKPSLTPIERFYALVGTTDGQCGDIMFNMHRTHYVGEPRLFNMLGADLSGTNQFFSTEGGHYDFLRAPDGVTNTPAALNIAFAIPPENQNPNF